LYQTGMHWDFVAILVLLGAVAPWLSYRRVRRLMQIPAIGTMERLTLYASTIAFQWVVVGIILWRTAAYRIGPNQLGLAVPKPALAASLSIVLCLLALMNQLVSIRRLAARPSELKSTLPQLVLKIFPQTDVERLVFVALVVTVALCEELIYRGFVERIFENATGGIVAAGIFISALFFAVAHVYQGRRGLVSTFVVGVLFATVRWWSGSIVPSACAHFVADLAVGLIAPGKLRAAVERQEVGVDAKPKQ
jgi:uncharacterized protein